MWLRLSTGLWLGLLNCAENLQSHSLPPFHEDTDMPRERGFFAGDFPR